MFRNYLLLAFRNMRKNKLHTFINLGGMTVAFACSIFILLLLYYHFSYDQFQANKNSIYKIYNYDIGAAGEEFGTSMSYPITPVSKAAASWCVIKIKCSTWAPGSLTMISSACSAFLRLKVRQ